LLGCNNARSQAGDKTYAKTSLTAFQKSRIIK
jgi:hypothetical protein